MKRAPGPGRVGGRYAAGGARLGNCARRYLVALWRRLDIRGTRFGETRKVGNTASSYSYQHSAALETGLAGAPSTIWISDASGFATGRGSIATL